MYRHQIAAVVLAPWLDKVDTLKDLKPLRAEQWVVAVRDFNNWIDVIGDTRDGEVRYALWNVIEVIPEDGPWKSLRLDIYRRLLFMSSYYYKSSQRRGNGSL